MSRILLLITLLLVATTTLSFGQSDPILGRATSFSALASTRINVTAPENLPLNQRMTIVYGNVGVSPGNVIQDETLLDVRDGRKEKNTEWAGEAMRDARIAYESLKARPVTNNWNPTISSPITLKPGVHKFDGNTSISDRIYLDADFASDALFIIIVSKSFTALPGMGQTLQNGAEEKNVYWIIEEDAVINTPASFKGNIIARGDITLSEAAPLEGRTISLEGAINFRRNIIFLPITIRTNLSVQKEAEFETVTLGSKVTYTITATNTGPDHATGVVVKERIPAGLKLDKVLEPFVGNYDATNNEWIIGNLALNQSVVLKLVFEIVGTGNITNEVIIIGNEPDPKPDDDEDDAPLPELPDLALTKTIVSQPPYYVGDVVSYTLTVTNKAKSNQSNVKVLEQLPVGLEFVSFDAPDGVTYDPITKIFTIPTVAGNSSVTITLTTKLLQTGTIRNIATIIDRTTDNDKDPDNDEDDEEIVVTCRELNVTLLTSSPNYCGLEAGLTITATEVIGATYTWAYPSDWTVVGNGTNQIVVTPGAIGGKHEVIVTVKNQCDEVVVSAPIEINITGTPAVPEINGNNAVCYNATEGTELSTPEMEGYTYTWEVVSGGITLSGEGARVRVLPVNATDLSGGVVKLTVTNNCGLSNVATKTIVITPAPAEPTSITGDTNLCESGTATFFVDPVAGATSYTWTYPADWKVEGVDNDRTIKLIVGKENGQVTVRAVNACGPGIAASKDVTVVPQPTADNFILSSEKNALCEDDELELIATEVPNAKGYAFEVTGGLQIVEEKTEGNKVTVKAGATGGRVYVTVTDFCGRELEVWKEITVTPKLAAVNITGNAQVCQNSTANVYTASAYEGSVTYSWTATGGLTITKGADNRQVEVSAGILGGILTATVSNGCFTVTKTFLVNTITPPTLPTLISGSNDVCEGSTITYSVPNVAGVTYTWTAPAGWAVAGNGASVSVTVGADSGKLLLTASDDCGNSKEVELLVNVTKLPVAPSIAGPATACAGEEVTYTLSGTAAGLTYTWNVTGWTIKGATTGNSITVVAGSGAGNISVTASNKCDEVSSSMAVGITPIPATPGAISHEVNVCQNSTGNVISVAEVPGATSYSWNLPLGWEITAGHNTNRITVTTTEVGGLVSVSANNCTGNSAPSTTTINITVPPAPVTRIIDNSNVCDGLVYTADLVAGATSYTWTVTEGFTIESGQGTPTIKVKATNPNAMGRVGVTAFTGACAGAAEYSIDIDAKLAEGQLDFPKAFSPNGDGKNDTWLVKNLEKFPDNELVIFNRWGSEVFKQKNYKNDWAAQGLGQGTYFYKVQVKLCDGKYQEYSGYITVFR